jgi:hypothetical protein
MSNIVVNFKIKKWSTSAKLLVLFAFLITNIEVFAVAKTWNVTTGNWNTPGNWSPSGVPLVGDDVTIPSGRTVTVDVAAVCNSITFGNTSNAACTINISGSNSLTVTNAITFVNPFGGNNDQTLAVGAGTLTCATIAYANTDAGTEDNFITMSTGTVNVGNIVFAGAASENSFVMSGAATLNITGAGITGTTGTFTVNTTGATVNYSGTVAQTIRASSYYNLNISGTKTTNSITMGNTNVANTFTNTATFTSGAYVVTGTFNYNGTDAQTIIPFNYNALTISGARTTNNVTLSSTGTISAASTFTVSATFTTGAFVVTGSTVELRGANQNINTVSPFAFNNLTCAGSGTKTAQTVLNINGTLNIGTGVTLNMATFALGGTLTTLTGTGTLNTQEVSATPIPTGRTWPYTINYNSTLAQTVVNGNYTNLTISGTRTTNSVTLSNTGTIAITGTFTASATFAGGAFINTGSTIDFNGTGAQTITAFSYNNLTVSGARTTNNITISGVVNIAGTFTNSATFTSGAFVLTGSTINYNGTDAQTVIPLNYNALTISGARTTNSVTLSNSANINVAGTFTASATFTSGAYIATGSTINLNGAAQNISVASPFTFNNLTCAGSGTKTAQTALNINGTLDIGSGITLNMATFVLGGTLTTLTGTGTLQTGNITATPIPVGRTWPYTVSYNTTSEQTVVHGSYNNLTIAGARANSLVTISSAGTINVSGTLSYTATFTGGALVVTNSTVNLNGANQNIGGSSTLALNNLTCSGSGTKTATGAINIASTGTLTINNGITLDMATFVLGGAFGASSGTGTLITRAASATPIPASETWTFNVEFGGTGAQTVVAGTYGNLTISGARANSLLTLINGSTINVSGTLTYTATFTGGSLVSTGNTINLNGASQNIGGSSTLTVNNLTCSGSGTKTATGTLNVNGIFTINSGITVDMVANTLGGTIASTSGTGTLFTQSTSATPIPAGETWTFTINYNSTNAQTVRDGTYTNLTISGARTSNNVTLVNGGTITVTGVFTNAATFTSGAYVNTANTFIYGGTGAQDVIAFNYNNLTISGGRGNNNIVFANSGSIGVAGTFSATATFTGGAYAINNSTVNLNGAAQNVSAFTFFNLTCSGSGTKTATGAINVNSTLNIESGITLNMATFALAGSLSTLTGTGTLQTGNITATPIPVAKTWPFTVSYNTTSEQTVVHGSYNNLTITGARANSLVTLTSAGTINVSGTLSYSATFTGGALIVTSSTINLNGSNQNIGGSSTLALNNLTCSGSGTKTATGAINIASTGTLTINNGITLDMATFVLGGAFGASSGTGTLMTQAASATPIPASETWTVNVEYGGTGAQTVVAGTYSNLTLSGARTTNSITLINGGTINVSGTLSNTASFTAGTLVVTGNTINFNGAAQNIPAFTFNNLTCSGSGSKTLTGTVTVSGALTISANTLLLNDNQLNVNGTLAGTPVFVGSLNAILTFNGTGALGANVNFSQTSATTRTLKDLVVNRTSSTITLANPLEIIGAVTISNGTLASAGNLRLISNLSSTARILPVTGTGAITGNVVVQRFINASARRFRFLSSPISNGTLEDWRGEIFITGNNAPTAHQSTTVGGALNWGFDATTGNQPTVFTYNEPVLGSLDLGYTEVKNNTSSLTNVPLTVGRGYRVFIRGDRSTINFLNGTNNTQNAVTMDLVGTPNVGDITMPVTFTNSGTAANDGWCLLGNPYACEYDWNAHWDAGNSGGNSGTFYTNIDPTVYVFDPNSNSFKSYSASANSGTISNGIIPSGQAFFVQATAASPSLTFKEQFKVQGAPTFMFKASSADNDEFRLRLQFDAINSDDYIMKFIPSATKNKDGYDIIKLRNSNFNIASYVSDSIFFALDSRPEVTQNDTLFLNVTGVNGTQRIIVQNIPPNKHFYLVDNMLNLMIPLSNDLEYPFQIQTSNANSFGKNRFYVVISSNATLPVKLNAFAVNLLNRNTAQLNWVTSLEINNSYFEIERSLDGENFEVVGRVKGNGSTSKTINYSYTDNIAEIKANVIYYRLNQYDFDGSNELSPVRAVNLNGVEEDNAGEKTVQLSPNPVVSKTRLNFNTKITAEVEVKIFSEMGLLVEVIRVNPLTNPGFELDLSALETGMYILEAIDGKNNKFTAKFLKQ